MSAIKPPGGPGAPPPLGRSEDAGVTDAKPVAEPFKQTLERVGEARAAERPKAADAVQRIAHDLEAGRIDRTTAIDRLIEHAMGASHVAKLSPPGKAELEAHLRDSLSEDPTLGGLLDALEGEK